MAGRTRRELAVIKVREILRLSEQGLSNRQIATSCRVSPSTVWEYVRAATKRGVRLSDFGDRGDEELLQALGRHRPARERHKIEPDYRRLHQELSRKGVTLQLLWEEYREETPEGYGYSRFCELYEEWLDSQELSMPQQHKAGEKAFVDYAGQTVPIVDRDTGEIREAVIFVATLGASNYTYVEAAPAQDLPSWLGAHVRTFEFFGGVPEIVVPDNLKSGVKDPFFYEPEINRAYQELAEHYGTAIIPARVRKPKDKSKVENAVQRVSQRLLAPLRHRTFFSVGELNDALRAVRDQWLRRTMKGYGKSRLELFELIDKPALKPLPKCPYQFASWKKVRVNIDYHVQFERAFYSVPYQLVHQEGFVRATEKIVEILVSGRVVAIHKRLFKIGAYSTMPEHMPPRHRFRTEWSPERLLSWGKKIGPHTHQAISRILASKAHPEQGFRAALGVLRLSTEVPIERIESACARANEVGTPSCRRIRAILEAKQEHSKTGKEPQQILSLRHSNVRGGDYYH